MHTHNIKIAVGCSVFYRVCFKVNPQFVVKERVGYFQNFLFYWDKAILTEGNPRIVIAVPT
jgi:hypothetical protein